jgi:hypothetical protein
MSRELEQVTPWYPLQLNIFLAFQSGRKENETAMVCGICTKYITAGAVSALNRYFNLKKQTI